jgi:hypothetical protein
VDNLAAGQLDAAAAGAELDELELELESLEEVDVFFSEVDVSEDEEVDDSELFAEAPFELLAASRLSVR